MVTMSPWIEEWGHLIEGNASLTQLKLQVDQFKLADVQRVRSALRINSNLTALDVNLGGITLTMDNLLPRDDRRQIRELLSLPNPPLAPVPAAAITDFQPIWARGDSQQSRFYVPMSGLSDPHTWRELGRGQFGVVFAGMHGEQPVCIKQFLLANATAAQRRINVFSNVSELALILELGEHASMLLSHTCVFATGFSVDIRTSPPTMLVLLPLMHGTLEGALGTASVTDLLGWLTHLSASLRALHENGVLHRDVAARNALLAADPGEETSGPCTLVAKMCDFGLSSAVSTPWDPELVPLGIWPPEVVGPRRESYAMSSDVWAFGLLLVDVLNRGHASGYVNHHWLATSLVPIVPLNFAALFATVWGSEPTVPPSPTTTTNCGAVMQRVLASCMSDTTLVQVAPESVVSACDAQPSDYVELPNDEYYSDGYTTVDLQVPVHSHEREIQAWDSRVQISSTALSALNPVARAVVLFLVSWCTRLDPQHRPSMFMAHALLQFAEVPPDTVLQQLLKYLPRELGRLHWTKGDAEALIALCRHQGHPFVLPSNRDGQVFLALSAPGAQLLGALLHAGAFQMPQNASFEASALDQGFVAGTGKSKSTKLIDDAGAVGLARGLQQCHTLTELSLSGHCIGDVGATALAAVFQSCRKLESVSLANNIISDVGAQALSQGIVAACTSGPLALSLIDLRDNPMTEHGRTCVKLAVQLCALYDPQQDHISIDLNAKEADDDDVLAIVHAIRANAARDCAVNINLNDNLVSDRGARLLATCLCDTAVIRSLRYACG
jgi:serine/threonine protein kinase